MVGGLLQEVLVKGLQHPIEKSIEVLLPSFFLRFCVHANIQRITLYAFLATDIKVFFTHLFSHPEDCKIITLNMCKLCILSTKFSIVNRFFWLLA